MTKKDHEYFKNFTKYWICKKSYKDGEMTVKNHNHISGKCWGLVYQKCNLNLRLRKKNPLLLHNLQSSDSCLIFQKNGKYDFKINIIPKTIKKHVSFTIKEPK